MWRHQTRPGQKPRWMEGRHRLSDKVKDITPAKARRGLVRSRLAARRVTAYRRVLPNFMIIGAQRSGTSSLYKYLGRHPHIAPSLRKETGYFSARYEEGLLWYRAHFPLSARARVHRIRSGVPLSSFEATPDYLFDPRAPKRAADLVPDARLLVLLRNPVDRAYSHYLHMRRLGFEHLTFEDALEAEDERIAHDIELMSSDPLHPAKSWSRFSYVARGRYAEQLLRWHQHYDPDQILVAHAENLFVDQGRVLDEITGFVGVSKWQPARFSNYSYVGSAPAPVPMGDDARQLLISTFKEPNDHLSELLGRDLGWNT